jgi:hypothetical protein
LAKSVAEPAGADTVMSTVGAPTTSMALGSGSLSKAADWPGISRVLPPSAEVSGPRPGTVVSEAGVPPAGVTTGWVPPESWMSFRSVAPASSRPG